DVVDDDPIARLEAPASGTDLDDLTARFVACDHPGLIALRPPTQMLMIDAADVRTADGRGLHADQHFAMTRHRNIERAQFHRAVARQNRPGHAAGSINLHIESSCRTTLPLCRR